jgi:hypothetical protein
MLYFYASINIQCMCSTHTHRHGDEFIVRQRHVALGALGTGHVFDIAVETVEALPEFYGGRVHDHAHVVARHPEVGLFLKNFRHREKKKADHESRMCVECVFVCMRIQQ